MEINLLAGELGENGKSVNMAPSMFSQNNLVKYSDVTFALISPDTGPLVNIRVLMASLQAYQLMCLTITCL